MPKMQSDLMDKLKTSPESEELVSPSITLKNLLDEVNSELFDADLMNKSNNWIKRASRFITDGELD